MQGSQAAALRLLSRLRAQGSGCYPLRLFRFADFGLEAGLKTRSRLSDKVRALPDLEACDLSSHSKTNDETFLSFTMIAFRLKLKSSWNSASLTVQPESQTRTHMKQAPIRCVDHMAWSLEFRSCWFGLKVVSLIYLGRNLTILT